MNVHDPLCNFTNGGPFRLQGMLEGNSIPVKIVLVSFLNVSVFIEPMKFVMGMNIEALIIALLQLKGLHIPVM